MKGEIRALEQAVCGLVARLEILLTAELGLRLFEASQGLHIETPDHLSERRDDAFVTIRPVGWPKESHIHARFFFASKGWELYGDGQIWANHLSIPVYGLRFRPSDEGMGLQFVGAHGYQREFVAHGHTQLIASLEKNVAALTQ